MIKEEPAASSVGSDVHPWGQRADGVRQAPRRPRTSFENQNVMIIKNNVDGENVEN